MSKWMKRLALFMGISLFLGGAIYQYRKYLENLQDEKDGEPQKEK